MRWPDFLSLCQNSRAWPKRKAYFLRLFCSDGARLWLGGRCCPAGAPGGGSKKNASFGGEGGVFVALAGPVQEMCPSMVPGYRTPFLSRRLSRSGKEEMLFPRPAAYFLAFSQAIKEKAVSESGYRGALWYSAWLLPGKIRIQAVISWISSVFLLFLKPGLIGAQGFLSEGIAGHTVSAGAAATANLVVFAGTALAFIRLLIPEFAEPGG